MVWGNLATGYWLGGAAAAGLHWVELGRTTLTGSSDIIDVSGKWNQQDTAAISVDTTNSEVDFSCKRDGSNNTLSYDLGTNLSGTWVLRFKINLSTNTESENSWLSVGFRSVDSAAPVNDGSTNFDAFGCFIMNGSSLSSKKRLGMHSATASNNLTEDQDRQEGVSYSTGTDYYVEVIRTATTTGTVTFRTGSHSGSSHATFSYTGGENATNLRYLTISDLADSVSGDDTLVGAISDITIDDNATSYSSADYTISFNKLTAKPYMMVLMHDLIDGETQPRFRFNGDTGSNYTQRHQRNGASDVTSTSQSSVHFYDAGTYDKFMTMFASNISDQEKLSVTHTVGGNTAGASNAPVRQETVLKWVNTSDNITSLSLNNLHGSGSFGSGAEVVVLGYDPDDTEGGSVWEELAGVTLGSAGDLIDTGTFTAKKYLMVEAVGYRANDSVIPALRVGNGTLDTGSNYARRQSVNGGTDATVASQTSIATTSGAGYLTHDVYFIINKSDKEKLVINQGMVVGSGAGAAPDRQEIVGKWANTSAQINRIGYLNVGGGSSDFDSGSYIKVWGFD